MGKSFGWGESVRRFKAQHFEDEIAKFDVVEVRMAGLVKTAPTGSTRLHTDNLVELANTRTRVLQNKVEDQMKFHYS